MPLSGRTGMHGAFNSRGAAIAAIVVFLHTHTLAQQNGDLQQQLQQLKQQYEQTTKDLQQRIAVLEQQIQKQNEAAAQQRDEARTPDQATVSAAELAAENAVRKALVRKLETKLAHSIKGRSRFSALAWLSLVR